MASVPIPRAHPYVDMGQLKYHNDVMIMKLQQTKATCEEGQLAAKTLSSTDNRPRHKVDDSLAATSSLLVNMRVWVVSGDFMNNKNKNLTGDFMDELEAWLENYWSILRNLSVCVKNSAHSEPLRNVAQQWFCRTLSHNKDDFMALKASLTDKCVAAMNEFEDVRSICDQAVQAIDDTLTALVGATMI